MCVTDVPSDGHCTLVRTLTRGNCNMVVLSICPCVSTGSPKAVSMLNSMVTLDSSVGNAAPLGGLSPGFRIRLYSIFSSRHCHCWETRASTVVDETWSEPPGTEFDSECAG
eukprot:GHVT01080276.1.p1 GENE.GHVT01080276.1~~GHVT01080276.1.p1  ORF type:complete len:111 (-),score=2.80 GHVT01080276.1:1674-2006(-)